MKTKTTKFLILSFVFLSFLLPNTNANSITSSKKWSLLSLIGGAALTYAGWRICSTESCDKRTKKCTRSLNLSSGGNHGKACLLGGLIAIVGGAYSLIK